VLDSKFTMSDWFFGIAILCLWLAISIRLSSLIGFWNGDFLNAAILLIAWFFPIWFPALFVSRNSYEKLQREYRDKR
jgi:hypothetical protein